MLWHEQSWPQIQKLDKQLPVVIPLGSLEQHGHHLPLFVDTIQVSAIAAAIERAMKDRVLLLPTLWLGASDHHLDFPGTVSVGVSLYSQMIAAITTSILRAGFRRLFFLNGHGGNDTPATQALTQLAGSDDTADGAHLAFASWWNVAQDALDPQRHGMASANLSHSCEYETSFMLALRPDLVHLDRAAEGTPAIANEWHHSERGGKVKIFKRFHRLTASGSLGKPSAATAAKGSAMFDAVVGEILRFLQDFSAWEELRPRGPS